MALSSILSFFFLLFSSLLLLALDSCPPPWVHTLIGERNFFFSSRSSAANGKNFLLLFLLLLLLLNIYLGFFLSFFSLFFLYYRDTKLPACRDARKPLFIPQTRFKIWLEIVCLLVVVGCCFFLLQFFFPLSLSLSLSWFFLYSVVVLRSRYISGRTILSSLLLLVYFYSISVYVCVYTQNGRRRSRRRV